MAWRFLARHRCCLKRAAALFLANRSAGVSFGESPLVAIVNLSSVKMLRRTIFYVTVVRRFGCTYSRRLSFFSVSKIYIGVGFTKTIGLNFIYLANLIDSPIPILFIREFARPGDCIGRSLVAA